jgi:hypothetical protein
MVPLREDGGEMRDGFPRPVVTLLVALFALSLFALLAWLTYFASSTGVFFDRFSATQGLWITAALSGSVALSSGLPAFHYKFEGYTIPCVPPYATGATDPPTRRSASA